MMSYCCFGSNIGYTEFQYRGEMKIEFKMSYKLGLLEFKVGDQLEN